MKYRQLIPNQLDVFDQPIIDSYLADLNAHLNDKLLENNEIVDLYIGFSLLHILTFCEGRFEGLINCLSTAFDLKTPPLYLWDELSDQY